MAIDADSGDVLHDEIRASGFRCAAVQYPRDIRMIETGKNLAFLAKSLAQAFGEQLGANHFYGDAFAERAVDTRGFVDRPHTAVSEFSRNFVRPDAASHELRLGFFGRKERVKIYRWPFDESGPAVVGFHQLFDLGNEGRIALAGLTQNRYALAGWKLDNRFKYPSNLLQPFRRHGYLMISCKRVGGFQ
jgi:hypothetical protein